MSSNEQLTVLGISGSLRTRSLNTAVVETAAELCTGSLRMDIFRGIGQLPFFNSDVELAGPPDPVIAFRRRIATADAVLFSCPEYAHGMSGVLKNALEWIVGGGELMDKPTAVVTASPSMTGGDRAQAWLTETLEVMGAAILPTRLPIAGASGKVRDGRLVEPEAVEQLRNLLSELAERARADVLVN
jgi:chromate reductase, NAD(P)H dehydrogenase (quinone)